MISFGGRSVEELEESFHEAVDGYLEYCEELGKTPEKMYKGSFNVRTTPELHKELNDYAREKETSLNSIINEALEYFCKSTKKIHHT